MRVLLATVAALAFASVPAAPAQAQSFSGHGGHGFTTPPGSLTGVPADRHDRRKHRRIHGDVVAGGWGYYDDWGRYNNRTFDPESFNDWWHERPWRSYPRWTTNGTCDRMWWSGGSWRC